jgi:hypothetical protein
MALISKGITLSYSTEQNGDTFKKLVNLQEIPDLGSNVDAVEITTLSDGAHVYMDGLKNYGDSLEFKFIYSNEQFLELNELNGITQWKVELPDNTSCSFGGTSSVKLDGVGVNAALTYTLAIRPSTEMVWA